LKIHVIRQISDYGSKKKAELESRLLRILFMVCSPQNTSPVLDSKKEEIILEVSKNLSESPVLECKEETCLDSYNARTNLVE